MEGKRLINSLSIARLLSFGARTVTLDLEPLNVFVGANTSGKSNFLEVLAILQAAPTDITEPMRREGISEWLWKGGSDDVVGLIRAELSAMADAASLKYAVHIRAEARKPIISREAVFTGDPSSGIVSYYKYIGAVAQIRRRDPDADVEAVRAPLHRIRDESFRVDRSILSQRRDPESYPQLNAIASGFSGIKIYRDWCIGRNSGVRSAQSPELEGGSLLEDASNLAIVLNELQDDPHTHDLIQEKLRLFHPRAEQVYTRLTGGKLQVYLRERGMRTGIPATRLSDGTLRFLCLLVILCHPMPPPLVAIEEPELGMHPDIMPVIAEMLLDASQRTQVIVTTHSDILVSKFRQVPEAIVACDHDVSGTKLRRLTPSEIESWPEEESLGELWLKGVFGGTRW